MTMNISEYFVRIRHSGDRSTSNETLRALHLAHVLTVPFENLDNFLGRPVSLEPADLFAKIVTAKRGGYCFELNGLFSLLLETMGFEVTRLIARVRYGSKPPYPRSHQVLMVKIAGEPWLVDVGFGGNGLLKPIPLAAGARVRQCSEEFRLAAPEPGVPDSPPDDKLPVGFVAVLDFVAACAFVEEIGSAPVGSSMRGGLSQFTASSCGSKPAGAA